MTMEENKVQNSDFDKEKFEVHKSSSGNYLCRKCLIVDGYTEAEKKCRWCGAELFEMDKA